MIKIVMICFFISIHKIVINLKFILTLLAGGKYSDVDINAEDNQYLEGVGPTLDFINFNKEKGLSPRNINSIYSVGRSTKKGNRIDGYIREKGKTSMLSLTHSVSEEENGDSEKECYYYMWKQKFPVRAENRVERRMDVEEWIVILAFPNQEQLRRGKSTPGIYAFLPTEMITSSPFIIQADFVLALSRATIMLDDKWNRGILESVPSALWKHSNHFL
ncbi:hypothetical protein VNO77_00625 [Canavalia gladiata]|uniref:Uncharacterized protein n=1 Tax=Canavalia gladiata TaxID=3824 RepID=A0AAN9MV18_CANGL